MLQSANPNQQQATYPTVQSSVMQKDNAAYLKIVDMLKVFFSKWYWFVLCLIVSLFLSWAFLLVTPPRYTREASILIKNDLQGGSSSEGMSFLNNNMDVNNELFTLRSPSIAEAVVRQLHLEVSYYSQGRFHEETIYGSNLNVNVLPLDLNDNDEAEFWIDLKKDNSFVIRDFTLNHEKKESSGLAASVGQTINSPIGKIEVTKSGFWTSQDIVLRVHRTPVHVAVNDVKDNLEVSAAGDMSTVISLKYVDTNVQRAEDVLSNIIAVYNENWVKDRNRMAVSTSEFIVDRIKVIEDELGEVENDISEYKSQNLIPASEDNVAGIYISQATSSAIQASELSNQLYMARYVRNYLSNENNRFQLIPANQGSDAGLAPQITEYNTLLRTRNSLLNASSLQNPIVQDYDVQLDELRSTLVASVDNRIAELNAALRSAQSMRNMANQRIASSPKQSKFLLSVERQQKVKENLYLYLLQKREENELSQAFTAYNSRVITPASGSNAPTFPNTTFVWGVGALVGLLIPAVIIFLLETINNQVRGRRDLEMLTIPFIGEIPYYHHKRSLKQKLKEKWHSFWHAINIFRLIVPSKQKEDKDLHIFVKEHSRNVVNEAFRVLRTNIEFMTAKFDKGRVIMLTSFNPNSGKTFVTTNLITSFALMNKRVVGVDLDLRKASLSAMAAMSRMGVSDYLTGVTDDINDIIVHSEISATMDVIPVGTFPPNPTELLFDERLTALIEKLREQYDYIFLDCPPMEIVADASIVSRLAEMTLFVIRADNLDRSLLPDIQRYYDEQRLPKMSLILNGTSDAFSYYGYHRYGSRYGYATSGDYSGYTSE